MSRFRLLLLGCAASCLGAAVAMAQTPAPAPTSGTSVGAPANPANPTPATPSDKAAASGDSNQAVATTSANADQPAKGANSFTKDQARRRIQKKGFSHVMDLAKDHDGVWRGTARKDGQSVNVWLDYKGNVGETSS
ncbi:MAG TPA: hypothetical protein VMB71_00915 [Acetobacteraceae bacterium]|nr:hypothetical protein [Acetobacteraceae bacterium]